MRIKLFTHDDLDGIGCAVLMKLAYEDKVDVDYCTYNNVNAKVAEFLADKNSKMYTHIFITDMMVSEEMAVKLNSVPNVLLIDHHVSNLKLAEKLGYDWFNVSSDTTQCGTSLLYERVKSLITKTKEVAEFVNLVRLYDTFLWRETWNLDAVALNKYGARDATRKTEALVNTLTNGGLRGAIAQVDIQKYFDFLTNRLDTTCYEVGDGILMGVDLDDISLQAEILRQRKDKHTALIDLRTGDMKGSIRSIKDGFNCAEFATKMGGGGHAAAAGWVIPKEVVEQMYKSMYAIAFTKEESKTSKTSKKTTQAPDSQDGDQ